MVGVFQSIKWRKHTSNSKCLQKKRGGGEMDWFEKKKKKKQLVFEEKEACVVQTHRLDTNMVECMHIRNKLKA